MIISDEHNFVFMHIPKCAGTSVRKALTPLDNRNGRFSNGVGYHPDLGEIDCGHIPLFILQEFFPREFDAIEEYQSFAIIRDPFKRFSSSIFQRLKMYSDESARRVNADTVRRAIDDSIEFLAKQKKSPHFLPPAYIHFQRQMDYVAFNDRKIIRKIYTIDNVDYLINDISELVGRRIYLAKRSPYIANKSVMYKNEFFGRVIELSLPITAPLIRRLPESIKQSIVDNLFSPWGQKFSECFSEKNVIEFIEKYYAGDIRLWKKYGA